MCRRYNGAKQERKPKLRKAHKSQLSRGAAFSPHGSDDKAIQIGIYSDVAMIFGDGWYLGRVLKVFNVSGNKRVQWKQLVLFKTMTDSLHVLCKLYRLVPVDDSKR